MKYKQLHAASTPRERLDAVLHMLRVIEARQKRRIVVKGRLILERRRARVAHWLSERRGRYAWSRIAIPLTFLFTLVTVSVTTWLFVLVAPVKLAIPALFFHLTSLWAVLAFKPYRIAT